MNEEKLYSTRDLYLATTLITLKFPMVGMDFQIEGERGRPIGFFKFNDTEDLKSAISKYTQGVLGVEPKTFVTNLNSLKAEVFTAFDRPTPKY